MPFDHSICELHRGVDVEWDHFFPFDRLPGDPTLGFVGSFRGEPCAFNRGRKSLLQRLGKFIRLFGQIGQQRAGFHRINGKATVGHGVGQRHQVTFKLVPGC